MEKEDPQQIEGDDKDVSAGSGEEGRTPDGELWREDGEPYAHMLGPNQQRYMELYTCMRIWIKLMIGITILIKVCVRLICIKGAH